MSKTNQFCDIGANLLEDRFTKGIYRGTYRHEPDLDFIMQRAHDHGVRRIILTAGTLEESREALQATRTWRQAYPFLKFWCTVGVHPTRCQQVFEEADNPELILRELVDLAVQGKQEGLVAAVGECGLDYERLEFCPKPVQIKWFQRQLQTLAKTTQLPLFLHNRNVGSDLYDLLAQHRDCWTAGGVVHSFDDTLELANQFITDLDLYIGLNGCSLRTDESLQVARQLPLHRILLETDCPYCEVRTTHPGYQYIQTHFEAKAEKKFEQGKLVKSRQEPCHIIQIAEIVAGVKQLSLEEVAKACYQNTLDLYGWRE